LEEFDCGLGEEGGGKERAEVGDVVEEDGFEDGAT
jgi:hypothetical protein